MPGGAEPLKLDRLDQRRRREETAAGLWDPASTEDSPTGRTLNHGFLGLHGWHPAGMLFLRWAHLFIVVGFEHQDTHAVGQSFSLPLSRWERGNGHLPVGEGRRWSWRTRVQSPERPPVCPLSPRERVRVRGKGANALLMPPEAVRLLNVIARFEAAIPQDVAAVPKQLDARGVLTHQG